MVVAAGEPTPMGSLQGSPKATPSTGGPDYPSLHCCERSSPVKNRMPEIGASGTVRGGGGNILTYSETPARSLSARHARRLVGRRSKPANERNRGWGKHPYPRALWEFGFHGSCSGGPARQVPVPIVGAISADAMGISPLRVAAPKLR